MHWRYINLPLIVLVRAYQVTLSPFLGRHCRFMPTCSHYAVDAYRLYNPIRASWLIVRRLSRCHPWGGGGYDPVPLDDQTNPNKISAKGRI